MRNEALENKAAKEIGEMASAYYNAVGEEQPFDVLLLGQGMVWYKERMLKVMETKDTSLWYEGVETFDSNEPIFI